MERRRTDRRKAFETALALLFWAKQFNVIPGPCRTVGPLPTAKDTKDLEGVKGPKVTKPALIGQANCGNPVNQFPLFVTKTTISECELILALVWHAVEHHFGGVLQFLEWAELREADSWYRSDYRLAAHIITLAAEGKADPYTQAFVQLYGKHPSRVVSWWRDRRKLLQLAELANTPTPLLAANQAQELLGIVPDFDYSQASPAFGPQPSESFGKTTDAVVGQGNSPSADISRALPPKMPAAAATTGSGAAAAGRKKP